MKRKRKNSNQEPALALEQMVMEYSQSLVRLAFTYVKNTSDAQDMVQDVFEKVMTSKIVFINKEQQKAWLIRCTINRCINYLKEASQKNLSLEFLVPYCQKADFDVLKAVCNLPPKYRSVIHLYFYQGYNQKEIAHLLKIPLATVKTRVRRAKNMLREQLGQDYGSSTITL